MLQAILEQRSKLKPADTKEFHDVVVRMTETAPTHNVRVVGLTDGTPLSDALLVSAVYNGEWPKTQESDKNTPVVDVFFYSLGVLMEKVPVDRLVLDETHAVGICDWRRVICGPSIADTLHNAFRAFSQLPLIGIEPSAQVPLPPAPIPHGNQSALVWLSFVRVYEMALRLSCILEKQSPPHACIGVMGDNTLSWVVCMFATLLSSRVFVPVSTSATTAIAHSIAQQTDMPIVFVDPCFAPLWTNAPNHVRVVIMDMFEGNVTLAPQTESVTQLIHNQPAPAHSEISWGSKVPLNFRSGRFYGSVELNHRGNIVCLRIVGSLRPLVSLAYMRVATEVFAVTVEISGSSSIVIRTRDTHPTIMLRGRLIDGLIHGRTCFGRWHGGTVDLRPLPVWAPTSFTDDWLWGCRRCNGKLLGCIVVDSCDADGDEILDECGRERIVPKGRECEQCKAQAEVGMSSLKCSNDDCMAFLCPTCTSGMLECYARHPIFRVPRLTVPSFQESTDSNENNGTNDNSNNNSQLARCSVCECDMTDKAESFVCLECDFEMCLDCRTKICGVRLPKRPEPSILQRTTWIVFTSGSTGDPKGAMILHDAVMLEVASSLTNFVSDSSLLLVDVIDSPLFVSSQVPHLLSLALRGARTAIYRGSGRVFEMCQKVSPTAVSMVPELWNVLYRKYKDFLAEEMAKRGTPDKTPSPLVIEKAQKHFAKSLGFRIRGINCGGAMPNPVVMKWLHDVFNPVGVVVSENYASTEAGPITNTNDDGSVTVSHNVRVRLRDWEEYRATDKPFPRGEILVKSPLMFGGYVGRPSVLDQDGYFPTGDIGEMRTGGVVVVIDRKATICKLANGEWLSPSKIEAVLVASIGKTQIRQAFVYGESAFNFVVAIVVVDKSCTENDILPQLQQACKTAGLRRCETPVACHATSIPFDLSNGMMTMTQKLSRRKIQETFKTELSALMQQGELQADKYEASNKQGAVDLLLAASETSGEKAVDELQAKWCELDWDSVAAVAAAGAIQMRIGVTVPVHVLLEQPPDLRKVLQFISQNHTTIHEQDTELEILEDLKTTLLPSLQVSSTTTTAPPLRDSVLVTGATGFVGSAVLVQVLLRPEFASNRVICTVRGCKDEDSAMARLVERLEWYGYVVPNNDGTTMVSKETVASRVRAVPANLTQPWWGLERSGLCDLLRQCVHVFHAAAEVHHLAGYTTLRKANVIAVAHLLQATADLGDVGQQPVVHFVSTASVLTNNSNNTSGGGQTLDELARRIATSGCGGYAQSKWVAERAATTLASAGHCDLRVYRLGMVGPCRHTGAANHTDWLMRLLRSCVQLGIYHASAESTVEISPVDYVASTLLDLALLPPQASDQPSWFFVPAASVPSSALMRLVGGALAQCQVSRELTSVEASTWRLVLFGPEVTSELPLFPLRHQFVDGFPSGGSKASEQLTPTPDDGGFVACGISQGAGRVRVPCCPLYTPQELVGTIGWLLHRGLLLGGKSIKQE